MAGEGFEPSKAEPGDLQSPPIGRSGNPPGLSFDAACVDYPILKGVNNRPLGADRFDSDLLNGEEPHDDSKSYKPDFNPQNTLAPAFGPAKALSSKQFKQSSNSSRN